MHLKGFNQFSSPKNRHNQVRTSKNKFCFLRAALNAAPKKQDIARLTFFGALLNPGINFLLRAALRTALNKKFIPSISNGFGVVIVFLAPVSRILGKRSCGSIQFGFSEQSAQKNQNFQADWSYVLVSIASISCNREFT